ncbi:MAG: hypothetical protein R2728_06625 [Chitinophagales bacterium]
MASTVEVAAGNKVVMVVTILSHPAAEVKVSTVVPSSPYVVKFTVLVTSGTKVVTVVTMLSHPFAAPHRWYQLWFLLVEDHMLASTVKWPGNKVVMVVTILSHLCC